MPITTFKLNLFLLRKIPIAWLAGIRVKKITDDKVVVSLKHSWLNQNPFRSIYFGVLVMAGELSTGIPLFVYLLKNKLDISMLVVEHRSVFYKKAKGRIRFVFNDFDTISRKISEVRESGEPVRFDLQVDAVNAQGEVTGTFIYTWSVKERK